MGGFFASLAIAVVLCAPVRADSDWEVSSLGVAGATTTPSATDVFASMPPPTATAGSKIEPTGIALPEGPVQFAYLTFHASTSDAAACEAGTFSESCSAPLQGLQDKFHVWTTNFPTGGNGCSWKPPTFTDSSALFEGSPENIRRLAAAPAPACGTPTVPIQYRVVGVKTLEMHYFLEREGGGGRVKDVFVHSADSLESELSFVGHTCANLQAALQASPQRDKALALTLAENFGPILGVEALATTFDGSVVDIGKGALWSCAPIGHLAR